MKTFLVALGANLPLGDQSPRDTLQNGLISLTSPSVSVDAVSRFYKTPCFPPGAGPDYVNAAAKLTSDLEPAALLDHLHRVEGAHARKRTVRWGMRTLDLDLIAAEDAVLPDADTFEFWRALSPDAQQRSAPDQLILPHPRLQDRAFVLVPLRDIAPDWCHPVLDRTVQQMYDALSPEVLAEVVAL